MIIPADLTGLSEVASVADAVGGVLMRAELLDRTMPVMAVHLGAHVDTGAVDLGQPRGAALATVALVPLETGTARRAMVEITGAVPPAGRLGAIFVAIPVVEVLAGRAL